MSALIAHTSSPSANMPAKAFYVADVGSVSTTVVPADPADGQPMFVLNAGAELSILISSMSADPITHWMLSYGGPETVVDEQHTDSMIAPRTLLPGAYTYSVVSYFTSGAMATTTGSFTIT